MGDVTGRNILVIEDEPSIADNVVFALRSEGFGVTWRSLGKDGVAFLAEERIDLVILDVGLPDGSGFERCKEIRSNSDVPILFLTARADEIDRVVGLEIGADDYVTKPFSPRELVARVKSILRRARPDPVETDEPRVPARAFEVDEDLAQIAYHGTGLTLTRYEYLLLKHLVENPERVYSRAQLMEQVWGSSQTSMERTVDAHVKSLRQKLRAVAPDEDPIATHRGFGYSLSRGKP
ncbi:MAG TPA: two-component system response regulator CreB [Candidatus Polarisedimenticolaceae bacterium]|nr:two-component system response regulator CreB [Candidatus Polarisedimenticolaceae bacterium]